MVRLACIGDDKDVGTSLKLAPRLRAASLVAIDDIRELDSDDFDGVVVQSHTALNDNCRFAADRGKHVLAATPPASSVDAAALTQECQAHDVRLMVGFLDRFLPSIQAIHQSLNSGQLGDPGLIRIHRWNSQAGPAADAAADIDLAINMFQSLPSEVYAVARRGLGDRVDYLQVHLGFPAGGMALIDVFNTLPSADGYFSLSLIGSLGAAYADEHHNQQLLFRSEFPVALKTGEGASARLAQLQDFVDAINEQREPAVTGADARAALLVREAAWRSIEFGGTVRWAGEHYEC
jgi:myo-inositol 2-dehydrogenase/D-chiro-inositol 1-dehydrogenase